MNKKDLEILSSEFKSLNKFPLEFGVVSEEEERSFRKKKRKKLYFSEKSRLKIIVKSDKRSKKSKVLARLFVAWLIEMLNKDVGWDNSYIY